MHCFGAIKSSNIYINKEWKLQVYTLYFVSLNTFLQPLPPIIKGLCLLKGRRLLTCIVQHRHNALLAFTRGLFFIELIVIRPFRLCRRERCSRMFTSL